MTVGYAPATAAAILNAIGNATPFSVANTFVKLHIGDPGAAGTANPAAETTRKAVSWGPASGGSMANDAAITWTNVAGSEDWTNFTLWDTVGPSGGTFLGSGTVTANPVTAGDNATVAIGAFTLPIPVAS